MDEAIAPSEPERGVVQDYAGDLFHSGTPSVSAKILYFGSNPRVQCFAATGCRKERREDDVEVVKEGGATQPPIQVAPVHCTGPNAFPNGQCIIFVSTSINGFKFRFVYRKHNLAWSIRFDCDKRQRKCVWEARFTVLAFMQRKKKVRQLPRHTGST